jgi:hypothetical protein
MDQKIVEVEVGDVVSPWPGICRQIRGVKP